MPRNPPSALPLHGWTVLSLRPRGQHAGLRGAAARHGARLLALSPMAIAWRQDAATRHALERALAAQVVVFTSPNAVAAMARLQAWNPSRRQRVLAVGEGTRRALARRGVVAQAPARMDSEGLLALPALQEAAGRDVGVVTAPGGRGLLDRTLRHRGATVHRAEVYARAPARIPATRWRRLRALLDTGHPLLLALSSGEALALLQAQLPSSELQAGLRGIAVVAASQRLANAAHVAGFQRVAVASSARPSALLQAACARLV